MAILLAAPTSAATLLQQEAGRQRLEQALQRLQRGEIYTADLNHLAQSGAQEAVPLLKKYFPSTQDLRLRAAIASALVRLGETESFYWDFLVKKATEAVESDAPFFFLPGPDGKGVPGQYSPDFVAWAKARGLDPDAAAWVQGYELPGYVLLLAMTGDPRGRSPLRKGLGSNNPTIQTYAAWGLAKLQDTDSIPLIIDACRALPPESVPLMARALVFFDDPRAQDAAEVFFTNKDSLEELRRLIKEKGRDPFAF